ncbi:MAG: extracellular solute-binding protein [Clostridia bacterium]|nr:extracellular solute-binding protein [Clostridia bacterium]
MKKNLALVLALLAMLSAVSCGNAATETPDGGAEAVSAEGNAAAEEAVSEHPNWDAVAKPNLGGMAINIESTIHEINFHNKLDLEELTGERLDDAIYNRNRFIETTLNCVIKDNPATWNPGSVLETAVVAGTGEMDLAYGLIEQAGGLITKGYLKNYNELPNVDMTKPYWDQGAIETLTILDKMYFGLLDFGFDHYESMTVLFYNGALLNKYQLEDPYELWANNEWVIDKFTSMVTAVSSDENGDGVYELGMDIIGLAGREYWFQPMLFASDMSLVSWDKENSTFRLNMNDEKFLTVSETISKLYAPGNADHVNYSDYDLGRTAFSEGKALFYSRLMGDYRHLRGVEDDYGVIGFPRYDYSSEESYCFVQNPGTFFLPVDVGDDNRDGQDDYPEIGSFLEAIAAYTHDYTLPEYTDSAVIGKGLRDQNSVKVFRELIQNRSFDLQHAFTFTGVPEAFSTAMKNGEGFASMSQRISNSFEAAAKKILDAIDQN